MVVLLYWKIVQQKHTFFHVLSEDSQIEGISN